MVAVFLKFFFALSVFLKRQPAPPCKFMYDAAAEAGRRAADRVKQSGITKKILIIN